MRTYLVGFGNFELHYEYDLISGKVNRANYQPGKRDYFAHRYTYDGDNRLTKVETTRDNVFWDRDARYFYYPHGPLARMELGQDNVQGNDHYYSIHGWIKGVNMPQYRSVAADPGLDGEIMTTGNQDKWVGRDAYAYHLGFYDGDYDPIGLSTGGSFGTVANVWNDLDQYLLPITSQPKGLYNGNIALMVTDLPDHGHVAGAGFIPEGIANAYQYDQLNRIKSMRSHHFEFGTGWTQTLSGNWHGYWDSDYKYDRNGNIEWLRRRIPDILLSGMIGSQPMDDLTYHYDPTPGGKTHNKLDHVTDTAPSGNSPDDLETQGAANYKYDAIGNLISDDAEHIGNIRWDLHGKVREVTRTSVQYGLPGLAFWYDGTGNRVHKRVTTPGSAGGPDIVRDEWYVRDPQGNEMAVYERYEDNGFLVTNLKEHAIYGSDRLGLDLNGVELSRLPIGEGDEEDPTGDPSGRHALVIGEIMYDSPTTGDDFPTGKEYSEGEYIVLINKSGMGLDLSDYTLRLGEDSLVLSDSLPAGERVIIGFGADMPQFQRITALPAEYSDAVNLQNTFGLPDRGGVLRVTHASGNEVDALQYGEFFGLSAENPYIADSLMDSLAMRNPLYSVSRESYGGAAEGRASAEGAGVDISDPGVEPEPSGEAVVGSYTLWRGRKVYELKNHLGNVLAVVSDVKIGVSNATYSPAPVDYYTADVVEMSDYEPFGMLLSKRHWVSGEGYRFGFQAQEGDDEWSGEGNMLAFKYRVHDARLGRFLSIDPLAPEYPWNSPYAFSENRVVDGFELEGLEWRKMGETEASQYQGEIHTGANSNGVFPGFVHQVSGSMYMYEGETKYLDGGCNANDPDVSYTTNPTHDFGGGIVLPNTQATFDNLAVGTESGIEIFGVNGSVDVFEANEQGMVELPISSSTGSIGVYSIDGTDLYNTYNRNDVGSIQDQWGRIDGVTALVNSAIGYQAAYPNERIVIGDMNNPSQTAYAYNSNGNSHHGGSLQIDIRPLRNEWSVDGSLMSANTFSAQRSATFFDLMHQNGFGKVLLSQSGKNKVQNAGGTNIQMQVDAGHNDHYHFQNFQNPNQ